MVLLVLGALLCGGLWWAHVRDAREVDRRFWAQNPEPNSALAREHERRRAEADRSALQTVVGLGVVILVGAALVVAGKGG